MKYLKILIFIFLFFIDKQVFASKCITQIELDSLLIKYTKLIEERKLLPDEMIVIVKLINTIGEGNNDKKEIYLKLRSEFNLHKEEIIKALELKAGFSYFYSKKYDLVYGCDIYRVDNDSFIICE